MILNNVQSYYKETTSDTHVVWNIWTKGIVRCENKQTTSWVLVIWYKTLKGYFQTTYISVHQHL